jgi:hypothetical protein
MNGSVADERGRSAKQVQAIIPSVVMQHAEEAAFLWLLRDAAVSAPHYSLADLAAFAIHRRNPGEAKGGYANRQTRPRRRPRSRTPDR